METVLIVEDEEKLASLLRDYLQQANYKTHCLADGNSVESWVKQNKPDAVLLDLMLPGKDGISICKGIRQFSNVPILMVTAKVEEIDRLIGLELGADDYICKPASPREVVARVKTVLRRVKPQVLNHKDIQLDELKMLASYEGMAFDLTAVEYQLLAKMVKEPGRIFSRTQLMDAIYDDNRVVSDRTIDSHVKKLRKKIYEALPDIDFIHSVYGVGYKYELE